MSPVVANPPNVRGIETRWFGLTWYSFGLRPRVLQIMVRLGRKKRLL